MGVMQPSAFEQILITTKVEKVMNWSRATSVWPVTFGLACCAIELGLFLFLLLFGYGYIWSKGALTWE